jgi:branched-chain amino acid transport system substrate-binding protein
VSWEYPAILLNWLEGAKAAGSVEPTAVLSALKSNKNPNFVFGEGEWWGKDLWGQDNALVGRWPVVVVEDGKARIQEYRSVSSWLDRNKAVLIRHMKDLGLRTV